MASDVEQSALKVSVIIPTYNRAGYLREALDSISSQSLAPWEVIVVDDGSTDDTRRVVQDAPVPVRYFEQAHRGVAAARNLGLENATGNLIAWLDSDDLWEVGFLATVVPVLAQDQTLGGVYTGITMIDTDGGVLDTRVRVESPDRLYAALIESNFLATPTVVFRKRCYDQVGGFDLQFRIAEDADMWLRLAKQFRILGIPRPLVRIRVHATNTMSDAGTFCEARLRFARKQCGEDLDGGGEFSDTAKTAYGYAFRSIALRYIENGQQTEGWSYMSRAVAVYPPILSELSTLYELACGNQARDYRGDAKQLDIGRNAAEMFHWLDLLFAGDSPGILALRGVAFGNAYLALGMLSDKASNWHEARRYLLCALRSYPRLLSKPGVLRRLFKVTFLTPGIAAVIKPKR